MPSIVESLNKLHLMEAKIDRYLPMIGIYKKHQDLFPEEYEKLADDLRAIVDMFKRDDRIVLLLRYLIIDFAVNNVLYSSAISDAHVIKKLYAPAKKQISYIKKLNPELETNHVLHHAKNFVGRLYDLWPHYVGLGYQPIMDYNWDGKSLDTVVNDLYELEKDFQDAADMIIDMSDDPSVDKILSFPSGGAWFDLQKPYCTIEGKAMGHCGNKGAPKDSHTVLSYRTPVTKAGKPTSDTSSNFWTPHLTFIFDKDTGFFTEMKGRANSKPSKKYHNVIIELLKLPFVKGIAGGGYKPENNFSIFDLSPNMAKSLIDHNPNFVNPYDAFSHPDKVFEFPIIMERLVAELGNKYGYVDEYLIAGKSHNLVDFFHSIGNDAYANVIQYLNGNTINPKQIIGDPSYYSNILVYAVKSVLKNNPEALEKLLFLDRKPEAIPDTEDFRNLTIDLYSQQQSRFFDGFMSVFEKFVLDTVLELLSKKIELIMSSEEQLSTITNDGFLYHEDFVGYAIPIKDVEPDDMNLLKTMNIFNQPLLDISSMAAKNVDELIKRLYDFIMALGKTNEALVLRGLGNSDAPYKFMDALHKYTKPNPMDDQELIYGHVTMNVYPMGDHIHLSNIMTYGDKGAGHGSDALSLLTELADAYDVEIRGVAKTYSRNPDHLQFDDLIEWYRKHGFEIGKGDAVTGVNIRYRPR